MPCWRSAIAFGGVLILGGAAARAQSVDLAAKGEMARVEAARREAEEKDAAARRELAARIVSDRETSEGRAFDTDYRNAMVRALAERSADDLQAVADGVAAMPEVKNLGDSSADLVYTPVVPCRVFDTRSSAAGILVAGTPRDFLVAGSAAGFPGQGGNAGGCGIPLGPATSVIINFAAVTPTGDGNLRAWAVANPQPPAPFAAVMNYSTTLAALANGVAVPICDSALTSCAAGDLRLQANVSSVHVVGDVVGYFRATRREQVRSFTVSSASSATTDIAATCTNYTNGQVTITAPVAGQIVVRANTWLRYSHAVGNNDAVSVLIGTTATDCGFVNGVTMAHYVPPEWPTITPRSGHVTVPVRREFAVAPGTYTYFLNATSSPATAFQFWWAGMDATFYPD